MPEKKHNLRGRGMSDAQLHPCPFCGGMNLAFGMFNRFVKCKSCCVDGPYSDHEDCEVAEREAINRWNARAVEGHGPSPSLVRAAKQYRQRKALDELARLGQEADELIERDP